MHDQIDLFSGIGGFALAVRWNGGRTRVFCEIEPFCQRVLAKHWPGVPIIGDIRELDGTKYRGTWLLTGGFPCQPFSCAGKRKGKEDDRFLWPEMCRVIREAQPEWVLAENVPGLLSQDGGMDFERVLADLEDAGYETLPLIIPACGIGAPHRRDRVWIVGNSKQGLCKSNGVSYTSNVQKLENRWTPNEDCPPFSSKWLQCPTDKRTLRNDDGFSEALDGIMALGNAIVPQIAFEIIRAMKEQA